MNRLTIKLTITLRPYPAGTDTADALLELLQDVSEEYGIGWDVVVDDVSEASR